MIIIGNKNIITESEKKIIKNKLDHIDFVDIKKLDDEIIDEIKNKLEKYDITFIVLNLEKKVSIKVRAFLEELDYEGIEILLFAEFAKKFLDREFVEFNEKNLELYSKIHHKLTDQIIKRVFDFFFSFFAILALSPVMLIIAFLIKIKSPEGSVFFTQRRLGQNDVFFRVFKFRTMVPNAEKVLKDMLEKDEKIREEYLTYRKLQNDPRIIPIIGHFLRKTSLDELPQFFNVLFGDMSIVGPRPYIDEEFYNHDGKYKKVILSMKPGITGYWQVGNRHNDTFEKRVRKDLRYMLKQSFILDIKIILRTIKVMVLRKGA